MTVTPEYQVRPPMRPTHFFLVDVSQPAIASGATAAVCSSIARILDDLPGGDRTQVGEGAACHGRGRGRAARSSRHVAAVWMRKAVMVANVWVNPSSVGVAPLCILLTPHCLCPAPACPQVCIATFDSTIHFYSMRPGQTQPHMLVVPDVTDVYCPLPGNVVVNLRESRQLVRAGKQAVGNSLWAQLGGWVGGGGGGGPHTDMPGQVTSAEEGGWPSAPPSHHLSGA